MVAVGTSIHAFGCTDIQWLWTHNRRTLHKYQCQKILTAHTRTKILPGHVRFPISNVSIFTVPSWLQSGLRNMCSKTMKRDSHQEMSAETSVTTSVLFLISFTYSSCPSVSIPMCLPCVLCTALSLFVHSSCRYSLFTAHRLLFLINYKSSMTCSRSHHQV